jgi:iron complex outermembrane receptor protein
MTEALWGQDAVALTPSLTATLGLRLEHWRAYDGLNFSAAPVLNVAQPALSADKASPKASLEWRVAPAWTLAARYGAAYRFPTVTELYQAVTTGPTLSVPNPNLKPEAAQDYELSAERSLGSGRLRLSLFEEHIKDALISQSAPLVVGSSSLFSFVQNVPAVRARGAEVVADGIAIAPGWTAGGSLTYVDARTLSDPVFPTAVGKRLPQLPRLRASAVVTWRPAPAWSATLAGRYAGREFATLDNSDPYAHTFQGFDAFFVADARVRWQATRTWSVALGVDNLLDRKYFLFHPFPHRSLLLEVKANY